MAKSASLTALLGVAVLLVLVVAPPRTAAVTCAVEELRPCLPAFIGLPAPSPDCCSKLKEQVPCICGYMKDPNLKKYFTGPNAKKIADACGVPYPPQC